MSPADDNPASFWDSVLTAIRRSGVAPEHHPLSQVSAAGGISDEVLLALFRGIADLPQPLLLVLDDFHVISNEDVMIALTDLASHSTPVHLMVLTRVDPPLSLHRLRMSGALSEVSASDLAFDAAAIRSLASAAESLDLSPRDVQDVLVRTEGWPTGVRLATMYLARAGQEPSLGGFGGTDRSVAEFLVAEVLERQDPEMRDFLMRTSIVDVISGSLADAIVPRGDGRARLEVLEHGNQFVVCVDRQQTLYRYHPLLRDLLQYSLQRDIPGGSEQAHRAAATWYRGHGDPLEALHHAVAAADWSLAASVFVDASPELVGVGRSVLHGLLQGIPFDLIPPSADLELCAAALEYVPGHFIAMEEHVSRARRLIEDGDALPPLALALLENLACVGARARGDEAAVAATAAAALEQVSRAQPGWATEGIRIIATNQCAVALLRDGKITAARERLRIVVRDEPAGEVPLTVLAARGHLAWCDLVEGDLYAAHTAARRVIDDASVRGWTTQTHARHAYLALALVEMLWGHTETADRAAAAGVAADVNGAEAWASIALHLTRVSIAASRRRPRAAIAALGMAHESMQGRPISPSLASLMIRAEAEVAMLTGSPAGGEWPASDPESDPEGLSPTCWSTRARVALFRGHLDAAHAAAARVAAWPDSTHLDDTLSGIEASLVLALVADRRGRRSEALTAAEHAVALAAGQHLAWPFLVAGSDRLAALIGGVPVTAQNEALVRGILERMDSPVRTGSCSPEPEPLLEPLTEREFAVLGELPTMRSNDEIAAQFFVSVNTVKSHLKHLYRKLDVTNRRAAVRRARELGLIP
jgi:LuxR family maltose regulon positive regulatory protein